MAKRRGPNEGTITKRADGRYMARLNLGYDANGKRQRKTLYGATRKEVSDKLVAAQRDLHQGLMVTEKSQTVGQFLDHWLAEVVKASVRPRTHESYALLVRLHLKPALGRHHLEKLTPQHVQAMLNAKLASGLSPRTVQYLRAVLRRALGQAQKWGLVARNVATLVDPPKSVHHEVQPLAPEQARALLRAAKGDRLEALYSVAVALGLRRGEILGLSWADVDWEAKTLRVQRQLQRLDGKLQTVDLKTTKSRRTLNIPDAVLAQLRAHRTRQIEERLRAGTAWQAQDWEPIFPSEVGTPLEARNLVTRYKALLKKAGLPDIRFHDLRHSCATLLLVQGIPARVVMEWLGHSQISMTLNTYSHVLPEVREQAASAMDAVLADQGESA